MYESLLNAHCIMTSLLGEFEDTKGESRIRISKKFRQNNSQKKKDKRTNNDQQNIQIQLR